MSAILTGLSIIASGLIGALLRDSYLGESVAKAEARSQMMARMNGKLSRRIFRQRLEIKKLKEQIKVLNIISTTANTEPLATKDAIRGLQKPAVRPQLPH